MTKGEQTARKLFLERGPGCGFLQVWCSLCPDWKPTSSERLAAKHFDSAEHIANEEETRVRIRRGDLAEELEWFVRRVAAGYVPRSREEAQDLVGRLDGKEPIG